MLHGAVHNFQSLIKTSQSSYSKTLTLNTVGDMPSRNAWSETNAHLLFNQLPPVPGGTISQLKVVVNSRCATKQPLKRHAL